MHRISGYQEAFIQREGILQIWIDADACPKAVKDITFRAAIRLRIATFLVANQPQYCPATEFIKLILVPGGFDAADEKIIDSLQAGDLVITADIPLAASVIEKSAYALSPRGKMYTEDNINESLTMRNLKHELRGSGVTTGGPAPHRKSDTKTFADQLDRFLSRKM